MGRMPIFDGNDNVVLSKKKGPGRPRKDSSNPKTNTPKIKTPKTPKVKTQFTFIEYLIKRFNLSIIAQMFKESSGTIQEWDIMVQNLADLLNKKRLKEEK